LIVTDTLKILKNDFRNLGRRNYIDTI